MQEIPVNWISEKSGVMIGLVISDELAQANLGLFYSMGDLILIHTILMLPENIHKNNFFIGRLCQFMIFTSHCYSGWSMMVCDFKGNLKEALHEYSTLTNSPVSEAHKREIRDVIEKIKAEREVAKMIVVN